MRHRAIAALVSALLDLGAALPERWIPWVARALSLAAFLLSPALRATAAHNLAAVFPTWTQRARRAVTLRLTERLCVNAHQCLRLAAGRTQLDTIVEIPDEARAILRPSARGIVVATGHLNNWELLGAVLRHLGHDTHAVVRRTRNAAVAARVTALRARLGFSEIPRGPYAALHCVRALRRGALVGLLCDQASDQASRDVAFLGRLAPTALGPATLARRTGARLVFAYLARLPDGRHRLVCEAIAAGDDDLKTLAALNDRLSRAILADPPAWTWFHDRWRDAPEAPSGRALSLVALMLLLSLQGGGRALPAVYDRCPDGSAVSHVATFVPQRLGAHPGQTARLHLPVRATPGATGAVVLLHGGGWNDPAQRLPATDALARRMVCSLGVAVLNTDYRLVQEGGVFPRAVEDVQRAAVWLRTHARALSIDPTRIHAFGASAGANLALLAASMHAAGRPSVFASVVSVSAPTDLASLARDPAAGAGVSGLVSAFAGADCARPSLPPDDVCVRASPIAWAGRLPRTLLIHADGDLLVPSEQASRLRDAAARAGGIVPDVLRYGRELGSRCAPGQSVHALSPCLVDASWSHIARFLAD